MAATDTVKGDGFIAERNSAFAVAMLHLFSVFAAPALLWNEPVVDRRNLVLWITGEALLALISIGAFFWISRSAIDRFVLFSTADTLGTAFSFSVLPWLGPEVASSTPSKHVLMIALVAVTSLGAANSAAITRRRPLFNRMICIVAASYSLAFALQGEWSFAILAILWSIAIAGMTQVGYRGMRELRQLREASENTARHDDLTGLLSRAALFELLSNPTPAAQVDLSTISYETYLVLFDLDGFKAINDGFGHAAGDEVLKAIAKRLRLFLPQHAVIGRLGGDEFAAILRSAPEGVQPTVDIALQAVAEPIRFDERELYVAASAGWTLVPSGGVPAELMAQADAAMYQSKNSETSHSTGFDADLRTQLDRSLELRQRFRSGLKQGEIEFWAQPLVSTTNRAPVAVELLARWPQDDDSIIGPLDFTRVADETGLAVELDRQALAAAHALLDAWTDDPFLRTIMVKVNISPVHLHNGELIQSVEELVPAQVRSRLGIEFVESRLISAAERNHEQLQALLDMGVTLSIDDFGVGYSSLAYLRSLPISEIKIDRSFVTNVDTDPINQGLVKAIVDIAAALGLPTVAEGIETQAEYTAVTRLGVTTGQGYLLAHPLPLQHAEPVLRSLNDAVV